MTKSDIAAKLFFFAHWFDIAIVLRITKNNILGAIILIQIFMDSQSLYGCTTKIRMTAEKRLFIGLGMLWQSYKKREFTDIFWILTLRNSAGSFADYKLSSALVEFIVTNHLGLTLNAWAEHGTTQWALIRKTENLLASDLEHISTDNTLKNIRPQVGFAS